jgi:hypothetical protein
VSNSMCGRISQHRNFSSDVKATNLEHENFSDLSSCSPTKVRYDQEVLEPNQHKMVRKIVQVLDVSDSHKVKKAIAHSSSTLLLENQHSSFGGHKFI